MIRPIGGTERFPPCHICAKAEASRGMASHYEKRLGVFRAMFSQAWQLAHAPDEERHKRLLQILHSWRMKRKHHAGLKRKIEEASDDLNRKLRSSRVREWHRFNPMPIRERRITQLRAHALHLFDDHPKCPGCGLLYGGYHVAVAQRGQRCQFCVADAERKQHRKLVGARGEEVNDDSGIDLDGCYRLLAKIFEGQSLSWLRGPCGRFWLTAAEVDPERAVRARARAENIPMNSDWALAECPTLGCPARRKT